MKNLVRVGAVLGGVVLFTGLGSVMMVGCGGDDTNGEPDSGTPDAHPDGTTVDTGTMDGDIDAGPDGHIIFDGGSLPDFTHRINEAFCTRMAVCCGAGTFDVGACVTAEDFPANPGIASQAMLAGFLDGGHLTFDQAKAADCLDKVGNISCGSVTSAFITDLVHTCLGAAVGNIAAGGTGCRGSAECIPPTHCEINTDAGTGTCTTPRAAGTACGNANEFEGHAQCGNTLTGVPGFCDTTANNFGATDKCQPQGVDSGCFEAIECQSNICGAPVDPALIDAGVGQCVGSQVNANPDFCLGFPIMDAGPG